MSWFCKLFDSSSDDFSDFSFELISQEKGCLWSGVLPFDGKCSLAGFLPPRKKVSSAPVTVLKFACKLMYNSESKLRDRKTFRPHLTFYFVSVHFCVFIPEAVGFSRIQEETFPHLNFWIKALVLTAMFATNLNLQPKRALLTVSLRLGPRPQWRGVTGLQP